MVVVVVVIVIVARASSVTSEETATHIFCCTDIVGTVTGLAVSVHCAGISNRAAGPAEAAAAVDISFLAILGEIKARGSGASNKADNQKCNHSSLHL